MSAPASGNVTVLRSHNITRVGSEMKSDVPTMLLRQLSYAIKTQLKALKSLYYIPRGISCISLFLNYIRVASMPIKDLPIEGALGAFHCVYMR